MSQWQVKQRKARLSDLLRDSQEAGPQESAVGGQPTSVIPPVEDSEQLRSAKPSFVEFLRASPLVGVELDLERDRSPMRGVSL